MTVFTLFNDPRFPEELRIEIWLHAIADAQPRTLTMKLRRRLPPHAEYGPNISHHVYYSPATIPFLLQTTTHTRHLAKKRWTFAFASFQPSGIWIDYQTDTLLFPLDKFVSWDRAPQPRITLFQFRTAFPEAERKLIRRVQVDWQDLLCNGAFLASAITPSHRKKFDDKGMWGDRAGFVADTFPGVESLGLVLGRGGFVDRGIISWGLPQGSGPKENEEVLRFRVKKHSGGIVEIVQDDDYEC